MPAVSVLMSVYNGAEYLRPALDSLLNQTFKDFELIVVDDASTDETPSILEEYEEEEDRMRILRNEENLKPAASLNRGLSASRAPLVARADADDIYEPERLSTQVNFMRENPDVGLLASNVCAVDRTGQVLRETQLPLTHEGIRFKMNYTCPIRHPAVMFRRETVIDAGGYDPECRWAEDVELWGRMIYRAKFANLSESLVRYRQHEESESKTRPEAGNRISLEVRRNLLADYLDEEVSLDEADSLNSLLRWRSSKHSRSEVERGLNVAGRLRHELRRRGLDELRLKFEEELFGAICSQSIKHSASERSFGWHLLREAIRISPRQMGRLQGLKKIAAMIRG